jgi:hypothetical protein
MPDLQTTHEDALIAFISQIEGKMMAVLAAEARGLDTAGAPGGFARGVIINATADLLGQLLRQLLEEEGEAARSSVDRVLTMLALYVAVPSQQQPH